MSPRIAASARAHAHALRSIQPEAYVCTSCLIKYVFRSSTVKAAARKATSSKSCAAASTRPYQPQSNPQRQVAYGQIRRYSDNNGSLASSTAINAPSTVPPRLRELHQRLRLLQDKASSYVDQSRLQLALRSLESSDPIIRVVFLGLGTKGVRAARKLAKVLLADELGEEQQWENALLRIDDGRSVLLKYGDPGQDVDVLSSGAPLVQEMRIPAVRLRRWNVEILVTGLNVSSFTHSSAVDRVVELEESILVPPVTIPNAGGRVGFVRYPVHRALIVADGVSGAVEFGRLPSSLADGKLISAALSLPLDAKSTRLPVEDGHVSDVSIDLAEHALNLLRSSDANGALYSEQWQRSRLVTISNWLTDASLFGEGHSDIKPAVDELLESVITRTEHAISSAETGAETSSISLGVPDLKRTALLSAIATWSEEAHRDLQMSLSAALVSPTWRRTTWWRLFWRIDEVAMSTGDILQRGWLVEAEQTLAFLSGRVLEAGLANVDQLKGESVSVDSNQNTAPKGLLNEMMEKEVDEYKATKSEGARPQQIATVAELMQLPPMLTKVQEQSGLNALFDPPWPQTIHLARQQMLHQNVPAMHRKAQAFMLASLSTIGGSGALAGWLWVASGGVALYEAGAIAAFGLVLALRRLQKKWSTERETFTALARENARRVLADVEGRLKRLVQDGGRVAVREGDKKEWQEARAAVNACLEVKVKIDKQV